MKTPPIMLSTKDCSYLSDLLETVITISKKARNDASLIEDKQIAKEFSKIHQELSNQYKTMVGLLK